MTNPHGYFKNEREEYLLSDDGNSILTRSLFKRTHKDINRDFPYLVNKKLCMESIGARVVNELFIKNKFVISLSLHGGTESLTYPYGTPNHFGNNPKIEMKYNEIIKNSKMMYGEPTENTNTILKNYLTSKYDSSLFEGLDLSGKKDTVKSPDFIAIESLTDGVNDHTSNNKKTRYASGDMNTVVYPVRGGMEDWAYSASWEGSPIISAPCEPETYKEYKEYSKERTSYDKNKSSVRNIMLLLEVSNDKNPSQDTLGKQNLDCLLNMKRNAFFNTITPHKKLCLNKLVDGYIPRIVRLSLSLIDIIKPYINFFAEYRVKSKIFNIKWNVGGSINVDSTSILYSIFTENDEANENFEKIKRILGKNSHEEEECESEEYSQLNSTEKLKEVNKILTKHNESVNGLGIWNLNFNNYTKPFEFSIPLKENEFLVFLIVATVDKYMTEADISTVDPAVPPQTHFVNLRSNDNYIVEDVENNILLRGSSTFYSDVGRFPK